MKGIYKKSKKYLKRRKNYEIEWDCVLWVSKCVKTKGNTQKSLNIFKFQILIKKINIWNI